MADNIIRFPRRGRPEIDDTVALEAMADLMVRDKRMRRYGAAKLVLSRWYWGGHGTEESAIRRLERAYARSRLRLERDARRRLALRTYWIGLKVVMPPLETLISNPVSEAIDRRRTKTARMNKRAWEAFSLKAAARWDDLAEALQRAARNVRESAELGVPEVGVAVRRAVLQWLQAETDILENNP